jgi:uncharacterized membrane protein
MHIHFSIKTVVALLFLGFFIMNACKKDDDKVDCSKVTGATFTSNSGKIAAILESRCGVATCHAPGGEGAIHWEWEVNYDSIQPHFDHMLEAVESGEMPEAGSTPLTEEEKDRLLCWKEAGFPE